MKKTVTLMVSGLFVFGSVAAYAATTEEALSACANSESAIDAATLASGCECMVNSSSDNEGLLAEILALSNNYDDDESRTAAASSELNEIIGQCFS